MMMLALLTPDLASIQVYPLTKDDLQKRFPETSFPEEIGEAAILDKPRIVVVDETPRPPIEHGDELIEDPPIKVDGLWQRQWRVVPPDTSKLATMRTNLRRQAREIATRRTPTIDPMTLLAWDELDRAKADPDPTPQEYPMLAAIAAGRNIGAAAAQAVAEADRSAWYARATVVYQKLHSVLGRIDAADGPGLLALQQELEGV